MSCRSKEKSQPPLVSVAVLLLLCAQALVGCGAKAVRPQDVTTFSAGVALVQQQSTLAFHAANALARDESIKYLLASTRPGITEKDFTPALDSKAIAAWDSAFAAMRAYASALQQLLSPDRPQALGNAAVSLGAELRQGKIGADISPGVATAFAQLGEILVTLEASKDAQAVMQKADPPIRATLTILAEAIGANDQSGVRGTVWSNWQTRLAEGPTRAYAQAVRNNNNPDQRREAIESFATLLDQRDAQLMSLSALRDSLLLLADAHTAAAQGRPADAVGLIAIIDQQLDETRSLFSRFSALRDADGSKRSGKPTTRSSGNGG
jgi:hypothetical protein